MNGRDLSGGIRAAICVVCARLHARLRSKRFEIGIVRESPPMPNAWPPDSTSSMTNFRRRHLGRSDAQPAIAAGAAEPRIASRWHRRVPGFGVASVVDASCGLLPRVLPAVCIHDVAGTLVNAGAPRNRRTIDGFPSPWVPTLRPCRRATSSPTRRRRATRPVTLLWRPTGGRLIRSVRWQTYEASCEWTGTRGLIVLLLALGGPALGLSGSALERVDADHVVPRASSPLGSVARPSSLAPLSRLRPPRRGRDPAQPAPTTRGSAESLRRVAAALQLHAGSAAAALRADEPDERTSASSSRTSARRSANARRKTDRRSACAPSTSPSCSTSSSAADEVRDAH